MKGKIIIFCVRLLITLFATFLAIIAFGLGYWVMYKLEFITITIGFTNCIKILCLLGCFRTGVFFVNFGLMVIPYYRELNKLKKANEYAFRGLVAELKRDFKNANSYSRSNWPFLRVLWWKTPTRKQ